MNDNDCNKRVPTLFVDLDGSLVKSDILIESFFALIKCNPLYVFFVPLWLLKGKAHMKQMIADRVSIDVTLLPYQQEFLDYLNKEAQSGRIIYLATASNEKFASQIADHLGIFSGVIASSSKTNMSGCNKLSAINEKVEGETFEYAGNEQVDMKIWPHAASCILVNPDQKTERQARKQFVVSRVFKDRKAGPSGYLKAIRVHQWVKNVLLFIPVIAAHQFGNISLLVDTVLGFVAFSLCASSVYLLNDLLDLPADRRHPRKRERPFASGNIRILTGALLVPGLLVFSVLVALILPSEYLLVLALYYVCTLAYSLYLKRIVLMDILLLAGLYTLRVIAGAAATGIPLSFWVLVLAMFMFLSLALAKRSAELIGLKTDSREKTAGRGYRVSDLEYLRSMGVASGYMSVLVLALYVNSDDVIVHYGYPEIIWLACPVLLYWISRVWLKTGRGEMPDDPIVFAFKDRQSQVFGLVFVLIFVIATIVN